MSLVTRLPPSPPHLAPSGKCGAGPNALLMRAGPGAPPRPLSHLASPARLLDALQGFTTLPVDRASLRVVELRCAGNAAARAGQPGKAVRLYTEALALPGSQPTAHLLLSNRAGARLAAGDAAGATQDARAAVERAPADFTTAPVRLAEALRAQGRAQEAAAALRTAGAAWSAFEASDEYRTLLAQLEQEAARELAHAA